MKGTGNLIYLVCDWLMRLAILNVLWITFTLMGGVVFGIFPASSASVALLKEWMADRRPRVVTFYWKNYKRSFLSANAVFLCTFLFMLLLGLNIYTSLQFTGIWFYLFFSGTIFLGGGVLMTAILTFNPLSHGMKAVEALKNALHLLLLYPGRLISFIAGFVLLLLCFRFIPGILPLYSVNIILLLTVLLFPFKQDAHRPV
ncbi:DUF624 domain-containing protein [Halobacillus sp. BAB-2008]|uniref:YesL family protein n=1 Tax=Halobacillus sp. BAB-2008 TaxID=1246484 RepID=UPI0002A4F103|nr:DUF624 domain-containing protein [Halobacillus sp. BAB-2008]ELK44373.1 integral membrane protein [Halobacillus sp. BAB-2008]